MARDGRHLDAVLDSLYDAALQPELLPEALHVHARALNGTVGVAFELGGHHGALIVSPEAWDGAAAYAREWWQHDFITQRVRQKGLSGVQHNFALSTPEERARHPFFQEFGRRYECFWSCSHVVKRPGAPSLVIGVRRPEERGPFRPEELELLQSLGRHAARAVTIAMRLAQEDSRTRGLTDAVTDLGHGVIGLGATGRVLFANAVAEGLCGDGLRIANGALFASRRADQSAIDRLIAETLALAEKAASAPPRPVVLTRPSGRVPAVLYGVPVPLRHGDILALLGGRPQALIIVIEPDAERRLDHALVREMFGLSPGEARLAAAVASGSTLQEAARDFRLTEGTARIVLKSVFRKIGVSRQSELVLLLAPLMRR